MAGWQAGLLVLVQSMLQHVLLLANTVTSWTRIWALQFPRQQRPYYNWFGILKIQTHAPTKPLVTVGLP